MRCGKVLRQLIQQYKIRLKQFLFCCYVKIKESYKVNSMTNRYLLVRLFAVHISLSIEFLG